MKELRAVISDEEFAELKQALGPGAGGAAGGTAAAESGGLCRPGSAAAAAEPAFEPIGFGMWADRPEMQDAATWVADLRERAWTR